MAGSPLMRRVSSRRDVMDRAGKIETKLAGHAAPEISTVREPSVETSSHLGTTPPPTR
jgi:hypothetical protein